MRVMNDYPDVRANSGFEKFSVLVVGTSMLASLLILIGWAFDFHPLRGLIIGMEATKPLEAVGFLSASIALLLLQQGKGREKSWQYILGQACAALTFLIGGLVLLEYFAGSNFGIDRLLFSGEVLAESGSFPGRPVFLVAACITILGVAMIATAIYPKLERVDFFVFATFFVGLIALTENIYSPSQPASVWSSRPFPLPSALILIFLSMGYLTTHSESQLMAPISSPLAGGIFARRFLPAAILLPLLLGWLEIIGLSARWYSSDFARVLFATTSMLIFIGLIYWNVKDLNDVDIQRYATEIALRQSEARFRLLFNATPSGLLMVAQGGQITIANVSAEELFGYEPGQLTGRPIEVLLPERFHAQHPMFRQIFETGLHPLNITGRNLFGLRQDGSEFPAEISLSPIKTSEGRFTLASITDITERKRAEDEIRALNANLEQRVAERTQQLENERARWQGIVEGMAEEVWSCDAEGKMSLLNLGSSTMMGLEPFRDKSVEEVYQEVEILYPDGSPRPPEQSPLIRSLNGEIVRGEEIMRHRQTGITRYRQYSSAPTRDESGAITGAVAIARDITEQKQAEEGLRRYELLSANSKDIVLFTNRANLQILEANDAAIKSYGYTRNELLTLTLLDLHTPSERKSLEAQIAQADSGGVLFETVHMRKDGSTFPVEVSSQGANVGGGRTLISIIRDITERKDAEEALRQSEENFSKAFKSSPAALMITSLSDGLFLELNKSFCEIVGYERDELLGRRATDFDIYLPSIDRRQITTQYRIPGSSLSHENVILHRSGRIRNVVISQAIITFNGKKSIISTLLDITDRKKAEEALRQSENNFSKAFKSSPAALLITRLSDGRFMELNDAYCKIIGYEREELLGHRITDFNIYVRPTDRETIVEQLQAQGSIHNFEMSILHRSGSIRNILAGQEIITFNGEDCILSTILDITDRVQAEAQMAYQAKLLSQVSDAVVGADENLRITYWNPSAEKLFGWTAAEALGKETGEILKSQVTGTSTEKAVLNFLETDKYDGEMEYVRKNGKHFIAHALSVVLRDTEDNFKGLVITVRDITERKRTEEQLAKLTNRLSLATYAARMGIWDWDLRNNKSEWNEQMYALYGLKPNEAESGYQVWLNGIHPEDQDFSQKAIQKALHGEREYNTEHRAVWPDGSVHWLKAHGQVFRDESGTPLRMIGVNYEITELKQAEIAIRESEERFSTAFHSSPVPQAIASQGVGEILVVNDAFCRLFEYSREELIGDSTTKLQMWEGNAEREAVIKELQETGRVVPKEATVRTKSGHILTILASIEPISWEGVPSVISSAIDITARKKAEEQIAAALKEKEVLLKEIHHRVKNNLQVISSLLRLQSSGVDNLRSRELFAESQRRVRAMALIHEQLYQSSNLAEINLRNYITSLVNYLRHSYTQTSVKVEINIDVENLTVEMDRAMPLGLLINELVSNSLKYAFPATTDRQPNKIWISAQQGKDGLALVIGDNGIGLSEEFDIKNISSMGLQLVDSLVSQLQGQLIVRPQPGAVFTIFIPDKGQG